MIKVFEYPELDDEIKQKLDFQIQHEFGHIPIVKETAWAVPDWTVIYFVNDEIASFYNIVERTVSMDNKACKIGGINNVITPSQFQGQGYATKTLSDTEYLIFDKLSCDYGLLLCAETLIPFYQRLNWFKVECPVYFEQPSGKKLWKANSMLLSDKGVEKPKQIDLNGLPW